MRELFNKQGTSKLDIAKLMSSVKILVADDDIDTLKLLQFKTDTLGWTGTFVSSASEIIDAMNHIDPKNDYDAVIADVNYFNNQPGPRLTGITAAKVIRKVRPDIPIIFITAFSNSVIREEIRRVQGELITKPFDIDELFNRVFLLIYWHRLSYVTYFGKERRQSSVNLTGYRRRISDQQVEVNEIVQAVIDDVRKSAK